MLKRILPWLPALCWMGLIYYFSGRTGQELKSIFPFIKNFGLGHLPAYFILAILFYYALARTISRGALLWTVLLCLVYGISDEFHQSFVASRSAELKDIIVDLTGAVLAVALIFYFRKKR